MMAGKNTNTALADLELSAEDEKLLQGEEQPAEQTQETTDESQPEVLAEPLEQSEPADERPDSQLRAPDGKFAAKEEKRQVPLAELIEERKERQRLAQELAEYRGSTEARLKAIQDRFAKPQEAPKPVDVDAAPVEALKETRALVQQTQAQLQALQQQQTLDQQMSQFRGYVANEVETFRSTTPDYDAALKFARDARMTELKVMGLSDAQARQQLDQDEFGFTAAAIQNKKNPAEALYQYAAARGYKKAEPQAQAKPAANPEEQLERVSKGQQAAKSLGQASGTAQTPALTAANLLDMTAEQIGALPEDVFRRLMGG